MRQAEKFCDLKNLITSVREKKKEYMIIFERLGVRLYSFLNIHETMYFSK